LSENDPAIQKVVWLGLEADAPLGKPPITPAQALQQRLEARWAMRPEDHDLVVMQHQFGYTQNGKRCQLTSSLAVEGEDSVRTAMAKTVGLPLGIAAMLLLQGKIVQRGVVIPVYPDIYLPTLKELARLDIEFREVEE
jgi:saccharopine dehydrogenase-like NADP-dependent oxidoreductase